MANDVRTRRGLSLVAQEPDLLFYAGQAAEHGGPVLVLGAGPGRVVWALAERGHAVLGVDPSAHMVEAAEERRAAVAPEVAARVRLLTADLRALRLPERFPLVLAPHAALGLAGGEGTDALEAVLATVRHHLLPGGHFVYDVQHAPRTDDGAEDAEERRGPPLPRHARPPFALHLRERRGAGASIRRFRPPHLRPEQLDAALSACGLTALERFGDFQGRPFSAADRLQVCVAEG